MFLRVLWLAQTGLKSVLLICRNFDFLNFLRFFKSFNFFRNYQQLDAQEKTLLKEKEDLLGLLESVRLIDEGSVCLQVEEELLVVVERELQKTREFKELVAVQEMPELLATNLNEARSEKSDVVEIKEN